MANFANESFDIPSGFTLEEIDGQLHLEDLSDDELWLIRMPCNIELSTLDRKKILLPNNLGDTNIKDIKTESGQLLECFAENCEIPSSVVLSQKSDGQLHIVKKAFKGTILISEGLSLNAENNIKSENEKEMMEDVNSSANDGERSRKKKKPQNNINIAETDLNPENGNEQYETPPSYAEPALKKKKKDREHRDRNGVKDKFKNDGGSEEISQSSDCESTAKKKKKKKKEQFNYETSELSFETGDVENVISHNSQKKHSKRHSHTHTKSTFESAMVKEDPFVMDLDSFPMCKSQTY